MSRLLDLLRNKLASDPELQLAIAQAGAAAKDDLLSFAASAAMPGSQSVNRAVIEGLKASDANPAAVVGNAVGAVRDATARNARGVANIAGAISDSPVAFGATPHLAAGIEAAARSYADSMSRDDAERSFADAVEKAIVNPAAAQPALKAQPEAEAEAEAEPTADEAMLNRSREYLLQQADKQESSAPEPDEGTLNSLFKTTHGTDFDPKSSMDKQKMAQIEELLQKRGGLGNMTPNQFALDIYRTYDYV